MTQDELNLLRERVEALAAKDLLHWLSGTMWAFLKTAGEPKRLEVLAEMEEGIAFGRRAAEQATFAGVSAAESDMCAAEYEEAYTRLSHELLGRVRGS